MSDDMNVNAQDPNAPVGTPPAEPGGEPTPAEPMPVEPTQG